MQNPGKVVVCIGSNSEAALLSAQKYANNQNIIFGGKWQNNVAVGVWVTNIFETSVESLLSVRDKIDEIVFLDQPISDYSSKFARRDTLAFVMTLRSAGVTVLFENKCFDPLFFDNVKNSKHFCIVPFVSMQVLEKGFSPCCLVDTPLQTEEEFDSFKASLIEDKPHLLCEICYAHERTGSISKRQSDNITWLYDKSFSSFDEVKTSPKFDYDVRLGNKCNLMCRTCIPQASNLINEQYFSLNLISKKVNDSLPDVTDIDVSQLTRIYVAGGEPTISSNFYALMDKLVDEQKTDVELVFNTNCAALPKEFLQRIKMFSNAAAEVSMDGYGKLNQYIRWPVKWDAINNNIRTLKSLGIRINFSSVLSIYNVNHFDELVSFINSEYPTSQIHIQPAFIPVGAPIVNFPDRKLAIARLERIYTMHSYLTDPIFKSKIDSAIDKLRTARPVNVNILREFFRVGEILDVARGAHLKDYNPELWTLWENLKKEI